MLASARSLSRCLLALSLLAAACGGGPGIPVTGLDINEIALYQGVKVTLMKDGAATTPSLPIVQGRDALVRVFVTPQDGWIARSVKGRVEITGVAGKKSAFEGRAQISGASSDATLASTINIDVPGAALQGNVTYKVALYEDGGKPSPGTREGGVFPQVGASAGFLAGDAGPSVKVLLIPMRYTADGSNRMPDTSAATIAVFQKLMRATYPVPNIEITLREPVDLPRTVAAGGTGWSETLQQILRLRRQDNPTSNIYYYGLFSPARNFASFCSGGCITGLSTGGDNADDATVRASIGVGFDGAYAESAAGTFIHEVGHAHGRGHSPGCGAQGVEPGYPYRDGRVGVWGYDLIDKALVSPTAAKDFMGYCDPIWVSDFTWKALYERISHVNWLPLGQLLREGAEEPWRMVHVDERGATLGESLHLDTAPLGKPVALSVSDADGNATPARGARFYPYDHLPGGLVFVREAELSGKTTLHVDGKTIPLR